MRHRSLVAQCAAVLALLPLAGGGCGGDDADGGGDAAAAFRVQSERLCRTAAADVRRHVDDFEVRVEAAARDADPVVLREETLRFLDDVERTFTVFYERAGAIAPPEGAGDWERRTDQAADRLTGLITQAGSAIEGADLGSAAGLRVLTAELGRVAGGVARAGAGTTPVLRHYDVQGCLAADLGAALEQSGGTATPR